jgi:hypothetical protein
MGKYEDSISDRPPAENFNLDELWQSTEAAAELKPLPPGTYDCRPDRGERFRSRSGTDGYKLTLRVHSGEHAGRLLWADYWLTAAALPRTKAALLKIGIVEAKQLNEPIPAAAKRVQIQAKVVLRTAEDGTAFNEVRDLRAVGIDDEPAADPFLNDDGAEPGEG